MFRSWFPQNHKHVNTRAPNQHAYPYDPSILSAVKANFINSGCPQGPDPSFGIPFYLESWNRFALL